MEHYNTRFARRTSSSDLVFSIGLSIGMHVLILLTDPLSSLNFADKLKEQLNGVIIVNLMKGTGEPSNPGAAKTVSPVKEEIKKKRAERDSLPSLMSTAPRKIAKAISPVHKPVHVAQAPKVESAPISRQQEEVLPPAPAAKKVQEPEQRPIPKQSAPKAVEVPPVPAAKKVQEPEQPPIPVQSAPKAEEVIPAPVAKKVQEPEQPPMMAAEEPDITITDNRKPKPDIVKPVDKPPVQEVHEPVKPEAPPPAPVEVAPAAPEKKQETPVNREPAKVAEPSVVAPVQKVHEPVKPVAPPPAPVEVAPAAPEKKHETPANREPAKAVVQPVVPPVPHEAPNNSPPSALTDKVKIEELLRERGPEPKPAIANPPEVKHDEKEKGVTDTAKNEAPSVRSAPVAPAVTVDRAKDKVPEAPPRVVDKKSEMVVKKQPILLALLKRFLPDKEPIGLGAPELRPKIKITTPAAKKVSSKVQEIGGRVKGNGISRVILSINGDSVTVPVENDKFHWEGALVDGKNTISATAWDRNRYSATDQIIVEAMPPGNGFALTIDEPGGGEVESPVITVKGKVGDDTADSVKLIVNRESVEAAVENGSFEKTVLLHEGENSLQAEAVNSKGVSARSSVLKVMVTNQKAPDILVHLYWEDPNSELRTKIAMKKRDMLDDEQGDVSAVEVSALMSAHEGYREKIFAVHEAKAGAYVLSVTGSKRTRCILSVTLHSKRKTRLFGPVLVEEEGTIIGRLLMPEGVYWDEDEWFTGTIENGDSITKYNSPEGMTWKEMK